MYKKLDILKFKYIYYINGKFKKNNWKVLKLTLYLETHFLLSREKKVILKKKSSFEDFWGSIIWLTWFNPCVLCNKVY